MQLAFHISISSMITLISLRSHLNRVAGDENDNEGRPAAAAAAPFHSAHRWQVTSRWL